MTAVGFLVRIVLGACAVKYNYVITYYVHAYVYAQLAVYLGHVVPAHARARNHKFT